MALADELTELFRAAVVTLIGGYVVLKVADILFFNGALPLFL